MKTRIISATVGIVILIAALLASIYVNALILHVLLAVIGCVGVYEAVKSTNIVKSKFILVASLVYAAIVPFVYSIEVVLEPFDVSLALDHTAIMVIYAVVIFTYAMFRHKIVKPLEVGFAFGATVCVTFAFWTLSGIFSAEDGHGLFYLLLVIIAAWGCDTGAYFTGYFFGKHKMAPEISPKKTIEGAIGGIISDVLLMLIACLVYNAYSGFKANTILILCVTPILAFAGMMGDLIFSYIKRDCGIKDYGKIMPGHGGVLDRFDSIAVVAPLVYIAVVNLPLIK